MSTLILFVSHLYTSDEAVSHNICLFTLNSTWMPVEWVGCCRWLRRASYNRFHAPFPAKRWTAPAKIDIVPLNHRVRCSHHRFCICIRVAFAQGITTVDNHTYTLHTHTHTHTHTNTHISAMNYFTQDCWRQHANLWFIFLPRFFGRWAARFWINSGEN